MSKQTQFFNFSKSSIGFIHCVAHPLANELRAIEASPLERTQAGKGFWVCFGGVG